MAYAENLHKLMAYKDEYEVARLHLDRAEKSRRDREFGPDARVSVLLHPPILRALGVKRKIRLRRTATPVFRALHAARGLRGTPFDVFGYAAVRRVERQLIVEYRDLMRTALAHLTPENSESVAALAALPGLIRGYEGIKLAGAVRYRAEARAALEGLVFGAQPGRAGQQSNHPAAHHPGSDVVTTDRILPSREAEDLLDLTRAIGDRHLATHVNRHERDETYPEGVFKVLADAGLLGLPYSEEFGGGGQPYEVYLQVLEELAARWAAVAVATSVHTLACFPLDRYGTAEQRERWLPQMLDGRPHRRLQPVGTARRLRCRRADLPSRQVHQRLHHLRYQVVDHPRR